MKKKLPFDAFISYSHFLDNKLAPAIQSGLHKLGKPWYRLRQLNVFRDETDLSAAPDLWSKIEEALSRSEYLIFMASTSSVASQWVTKEIEYWLENKDSKKIILVRTNGNIGWDNNKNDFDWAETNCLPKILSGKFLGEPLHVDLTEVRKSTDLSLLNPSFKIRIAQISSTIQNISLKDLIDQDVTEHRKTIRIRNAAVWTITCFIIALIATGLIILNQRNKALKIAVSNEHVLHALNKNSITQSLIHIHEAYSLNSSPYIANLLTHFGQNPVSFYDWIDIKDTVRLSSFATINDTLYSGYDNGFIKAMGKKGELIAVNKFPVQEITEILSLPSAQKLIVYGYSDSMQMIEINVLDSRTLRAFTKFYISNGFRSIHTTLDGQLLITNSDNDVKKIDLKGTVKNSIHFEDNEISDAFLTAEQELVVLEKNQIKNESYIRKYSAQGKAIAAYELNERTEIKCIALDAAHSILLALDSRGTTYIWDSAGSPKFTTKLSATAITGVEDRLTFGKCKFSSTVQHYMININDNCIIRSLDGKSSHIASLLTERLDEAEFSEREGRFYSAGAGSGFIFCWDYRGNLIQKKDYFKSDQIILGDNSGKYIVQKSDTLFLYTLNDNILKTSWQTNIKNIRSFKEISDTSLIVTGDSCVEICSISKRGVKRVVTCLNQQKILYADIKYKKLYTGIANGIIGIYDLITKQEKRFYVSPDISFVKTNNNGDILVGGGVISKPGFLKLYSKDLKLKQTFFDVDDLINDAIFINDETFYTVDDGGKLISWKVTDSAHQNTIQASMGISMNIGTSPGVNYFITNGMIANEIILIDKSGNKIQTIQTEREVNDFNAIDDNHYAFVCGKSLYYYYTPAGFIKSERITNLEKLSALEKEMNPFSVHSDIRRVLTLDEKLQ